jgi:hypothetical protein
MATIKFTGKGRFGAPGPAAGQFNRPTAVAVNDSTHDVYVLDQGNDRVEAFNEKGEYQFEFNGSGLNINEGLNKPPTGQFSFLSEEPAQVSGIAIDNDPSSPSFEDVYVVDAGHDVVDKFSASGAYITQLTGFSELLGVAVDPAGNVWVSDAGIHVAEFGDAVLNSEQPPGFTVDFAAVPGLAVDSDDGMYIHAGADGIQKFTDTGEEIYIPKGPFATFGSGTGVAVDESTNDLYVDEGGSVVARYGPFGEPYGATPVGEFGSAAEIGSDTLADGGGQGIAVDSSTGSASSGDVYVVDSVAGVVDVFGEALVPNVVAEPVSSFPAATSATLEGTVNPEGSPITNCEFEYSDATAYGEVQTLTFAGATGGAYSLTLDGQSTAATGTGDPVGPATGSGELLEGSNTITGVSATEGTFVVGEQITGPGIPTTTTIPATETKPATTVPTTIVSVHPGVIVLSTDATASGSVTLKAADDQVTAVNTTTGTFAAGEQIEGAGIPAGTTIVAVGAGTLTLSAAVTASGTDVALSSALAYNASAAQVQSALEGLSLVGVGAVAVSGTQGGPYTVAFQGTLAHTKVPELTADSGALTPAGASVTVAVTSEGGHRPGTAPCVPEASVAKPLTGTTPIAVSATAPGLTQGDTYDYRLRATNTAGPIGASSERSFFMPYTVKVDGESTPFVEPNAATLEADINPGGSHTAYHFEYGPAAGPYDVSLPIPDGDVGAGLIDVHVSVRVTDLTPGTSYHYRVVASNALAGQVDGPDEVFNTPNPPSSAPETCPNAQLRREQPYGLTLPDCRAYEMVSPLEKNDSDAAIADDDAARSSLSGDVFTYSSPGVFAGAEGSQLINQYVARRGSDGWSNEAVTPPYAAYGSGTANFTTAYRSMAFTPELSEGVATTDTPLESQAMAGYENLYVADFAITPVSYRLVTIEGGAPIEGGDSEPVVMGASADLSHIVFEKGDSTSGGEWVDGVVTHLPMVGGGDEQPGNESGADSWRSVSADGSRVFYTTVGKHGPDAVQGLGRDLEVVENATNPTEDCSVAGDACTVEVSASQRKVPDPLGPGAARFRGASVNGSRVFFTDCSKLTGNATAFAPKSETTCYPTDEPGSNPGNDLYEYDLETGVLTDLTAITKAEKAEDPIGATVVGVPYISESGEYVYFVAEGALAAGQNLEGQRPVAGEPNLYVDHLEGGSWTMRFITTLAPSTIDDERFQEGGDSTDWSRMSPLDSVAATADGTHLAFLSKRSLTGYNNEQAEAGECENNYAGKDISEGSECREVFSYDAVSQKLVCVSCNPLGARPVGPSDLGERGEHEFSSTPMGYQPRHFSENGGRLFFDSGDALVRHDSNGRQDVYEYEQLGEGSCEEEEGCVYPISDVAGDYESFFLDADPSGENVFFATEDQLVPADTDHHIDIYDARVGGGFPVAASSPECDNADSCKPPASPQPGVFATPSSATFSGPGNPAPSATTTVTPKKRTSAEIKAEKLTDALKACRRDGSAKKRASCQRAARKRYGASKAQRAKKASNDRRAH